jgi:EAL domain-containing protein (putative c-di-GMP-specific phosphodiesterase class I)
VGRYWEGLRACADEIRRTLPSWRDSTFGTLRREAGMTRRQIARLGRPSGDDDGDELDRWSLEAAMADAALAYHRYLVSIDGHVSYDARRGVAMFDRQDELDRANLLEQRMQATIHERNAYIERHRAAFAALPDSFQATFH